MGGPGREAFEATAWFDANVVDGAVNGAGANRARARRRACAASRTATCAPSAGVISVGVALVLAWLVVFQGIL